MKNYARQGQALNFTTIKDNARQYTTMQNNTPQ